jgi:hypothetical protein
MYRAIRSCKIPSSNIGGRLLIDLDQAEIAMNLKLKKPTNT